MLPPPPPPRRDPVRRRAPRAGRGHLPLALLTVLTVLGGARGAGAGDPVDRDATSEDPLDLERRASVRRGCAWIASQMNPDGNFGEGRASVAITSLSTLALLAGGSGVGRGPHGEAVAKGTRFLVNLVEERMKAAGAKGRAHDDTGYFFRDGDVDSRMHGHGYAMLALASAMGSADEDLTTRIRKVLRQAVRCAETSQTPTGGWGYNPTPSQDHEGSVTVTVAQGLRAAHDAGVKVSSTVIANGLRYLRQSQKPDGSFKYSIQQDRSTYALTAAAVSSFLLLGRYAKDDVEGDGQRIRDGVRYLKRSLHDVMVRREWYYYGHFYAAWAAWQLDGGNRPDGGPARDARLDDDPTRLWGPLRTQVVRALLDEQRLDGSWHDENDTFRFHDLLPTSFAVLTLAISDEVLPIFQR